MEQRLLLSFPFHIWGLLGLENLSMVPQITLWNGRERSQLQVTASRAQWRNDISVGPERVLLLQEMRFQLAEVAEVQRPKSLLSGSDAGQSPCRASWKLLSSMPHRLPAQSLSCGAEAWLWACFLNLCVHTALSPSLSSSHTSSSASGVSPILSLMCRSPLWCSLCHLICLCLLPLHFSRTAWKDSTASLPSANTASTPCLHFIPLPSEFQLFFCLPGSPKLFPLCIHLQS